MTDIYVLQLEHSKVYVGKSDDVKERYKAHCEGRGAAWTKVHKPIKILKTFKSTSPIDEDRTLKEMMLKYGIDNVRGGVYCQLMLPKSTRLHLEKEIMGATDRCYRCGKTGHYASGCRDPSLVIKRKRENSQICPRCGRNGHSVENCYVKKHKNGTMLTDSQPVNPVKSSWCTIL